MDARRKVDENPNINVVADTMKLLANSSYGYQNVDPSQDTVTKYLGDEKTQTAVLGKLFKKLDLVKNSFYEVELAKAQIEHKEPIIVEFFILQYAKLEMLASYYRFSGKVCDAKVPRVGNGHSFVVSCSCREKTGQLYPTWNKNRMERLR